MLTHTPAPWTVVYHPDSGYSVWHDPRVHGDKRRGAVIICCDMRAGEEAGANAQLVAAAPNMLTALECALGYLGDDATDDSPEAREARSVIRAAIKLAKGEP